MPDMPGIMHQFQAKGATAASQTAVVWCCLVSPLPSVAAGSTQQALKPYRAQLIGRPFPFLAPTNLHAMTFLIREIQSREAWRMCAL